MKTMICILALIAAAGVKAQTTIQRSFHSNGTVQEVRVTEEDKVTFVRYYETGKVYERGAFLKNQRDGVWKRFGANGELVAKVHFKNGLRDGKCMYAGLPDGSRFKVEYADGRMIHGEQFDPQGNVLAERDMR